MSTTVACELPGRAGDIARSFGARLRIVDFYDEVGSEVYDRLTRSDRSEVAEFVARVRRTGGPVLELAAGAGRLTLPLLSCGPEVVAVDNSPAMLALLRQRLDTAAGRRLAPRLTTIEADMTLLDLDRRFRSVVLGTTTISLLDTDQRLSLFDRVALHLDDDGRFFMSTLEFGGSSSSMPVEAAETFDDGDAQYTLMEYVDFARSRRWVSLLHETADGEPLLVTTTTHVVHTESIEAQLEQAGFDVVDMQVVAEGSLFEESARRTILIEARSSGEL